jgi:outer membrane lipoprotein-sorting protein
MGTRKYLTAAFALLATLLIWTAASAQTETAKPADTLTGDQLMARFIDASGGKAAYDKLNTRYQHATVELMANLKVPITLWFARPNKMKSSMSNDQIGSIDRGYDGKLFWERTTMTGTRLLEGQELTDAIREEATFDRFTDWKSLYPKTEYLGSDSAAGVMCQKVRVVPKDGPEQTWYFDKSTGLLHKIAITMNTQMGVVPADVTLSDYRKVDGVMMPYLMTTTAVGMDMKMVIDSIAHNIPIPDSVFAAPAEAVKLAQPKK